MQLPYYISGLEGLGATQVWDKFRRCVSLKMSWRRKWVINNTKQSLNLEHMLSAGLLLGHLWLLGCGTDVLNSVPQDNLFSPLEIWTQDSILTIVVQERKKKKFTHIITNSANNGHSFWVYSAKNGVQLTVFFPP